MTRRGPDPKPERIAPEAFLAELPLFRELDAAAVARLAASTTRRHLKRGEVLFRKGVPATAMYVVVFGEVKLLAREARFIAPRGSDAPDLAQVEPHEAPYDCPRNAFLLVPAHDDSCCDTRQAVDARTRRRRLPRRPE